MFELTLITPTSNRTITVAWLEFETPLGSMVIQRGHAPLVAALQSYREIRFENKHGVVETMELSGGIVEVRRHSALIVVD